MAHFSDVMIFASCSINGKRVDLVRFNFLVKAGLRGIHFFRVVTHFVFIESPLIENKGGLPFRCKFLQRVEVHFLQLRLPALLTGNRLCGFFFAPIFEIGHVPFDWVKFSPIFLGKQSEFVVGNRAILIRVQVVKDGLDVFKGDLDS